MFTHGIDRIRDFESGDDDIDLRGIAGLDSWAELRSHLVQSGSHTVFQWGTNQLIIENTSVRSLDAEDFMW